MGELGYYIEVQNAFGTPLAQIADFVSLKYVRSLNTFGALVLELSPDIDDRLFVLDGRLLVYRNNVLDMGAVWLVRLWGRGLSESGERVFFVEAVSADEILNHPIVAYNAGSAQAEKTSAADDMMKAIVRENLGSDAVDTARSLAAYLSIEANLSLAPSVTKKFSRRKVLPVLQEIADLSAQSGTPLYFDIIPTGGSALEFRTFTWQRGADRTADGLAPLILSPELGTISSGRLVDDYSTEVNVVYAAGSGVADDRVVVEVVDSARSGMSPLNRREALCDSRNSTDVASLTGEAMAALYAGRARRKFSGTLVDSVQVRYGRDWFYGDAVSVLFEGISFDCLISRVSVSVASGSESVRAGLAAEVLL